jgi:hypothetical protein
MCHLNVMFNSVPNIGVEIIYNSLYMAVIQSMCYSFLNTFSNDQVIKCFWESSIDIFWYVNFMKFMVYTASYLMFISI